MYVSIYAHFIFLNTIFDHKKGIFNAMLDKDLHYVGFQSLANFTILCLTNSSELKADNRCVGTHLKMSCIEWMAESMAINFI